MWPDKSVNAVVCMKYLTATADPINILDDPIIITEMNLLWKLGGDEAPVDLFDKITWGVKDYTPLQRIVYTMMTIQPTQNQLVEKHVQLAALVRKTNVGQARATASGDALLFHPMLQRGFSSKKEREEKG